VGVEEATIASLPTKACEMGGIYTVGGGDGKTPISRPTNYHHFCCKPSTEDSTYQNYGVHLLLSVSSCLKKNREINDKKRMRRLI